MDRYGRLSIALWEYLEATAAGDEYVEWAHADIMDRVEEWCVQIENDSVNDHVLA